MPHDDYQEVYTAPKTQGHLLDTIWRLKHNLDIVGDFVNTLEEVIILSGVAGGTVTAGDVVYVSASNTVTRAQANAVNTSDVIAIALTGGTVGQAITFQVTGCVERVGWGLTAASIYYLSAGVAGALTTTAPTTTGQVVVVIGKTVTSDKLVLQIGQGILL